MTREEAIINLKLSQNRIGGIKKEEWNALQMAIEALENKPTPCEKCIHVKSCRKVIILKNRTYKLIKYCSQGAERKGEQQTQTDIVILENVERKAR